MISHQVETKIRFCVPCAHELILDDTRMARCGLSCLMIIGWPSLSTMEGHRCKINATLPHALSHSTPCTGKLTKRKSRGSTKCL